MPLPWSVTRLSSKKVGAAGTGPPTANSTGLCGFRPIRYCTIEIRRPDCDWTQSFGLACDDTGIFQERNRSESAMTGMENRCGNPFLQQLKREAFLVMKNACCERRRVPDGFGVQRPG